MPGLLGGGLPPGRFVQVLGGLTLRSTLLLGQIIGRSAMSKLSHSAKKFSAAAWTTDGWIVPRSGLTSAPLTDEPGADWLTSYMAALPASRFPLRGSAEDQQTSETCSPTLSASSANPNPQLSFWKMCLDRCRNAVVPAQAIAAFQDLWLRRK